jgi:hypothetical protein
LRDASEASQRPTEQSTFRHPIYKLAITPFAAAIRAAPSFEEIPRFSPTRTTTMEDICPNLLFGPVGDLKRYCGKRVEQPRLVSQIAPKNQRGTLEI